MWVPVKRKGRPAALTRNAHPTVPASAVPSRVVSHYAAPVPLNILVTGGAGFIGSRLAARLSDAGHRVVILDSLVPQVHGSRIPEVAGELVRADVRDEGALAEAMVDVDVVHHLAAETGVGQSQYEISRYVGATTFGTAVVLEQAVRAGVRQVVIASSRAVYGEGAHRCERCAIRPAPVQRQPADLERGVWDVPCPACSSPATPVPTTEDAPLSPSSVYGVTKLHQEQLAATVSAAHGLATTTLRLFNVFGPGQSLQNPYVGVLGVFLRRLRSGEPVEIYEDAGMLRDFVFVDDVVEIFTRCTNEPRAFGSTWNVGSGRAVTLGNLIDALSRALAVEPTVEVSGRYRLGDVRHAFADVSRLERDLGYRPATRLDEGVRAFVEWAQDDRDDAPDAAAEEQLRSWNLLRQAAV